MRGLLFTAGLLLAATFAFAADKSSEAGVPVQMVVTVEAQHGKDVPMVNREDAIVHQRAKRLGVTDWVPLRGDRAGLELFIMLDDSSSGRLGSYFGELRQFILSQPAATSIAIGYMRNGTYFEAQSLTSDHDKAAKALRLPVGSAAAGASPYLSLSDLVKRWPRSQNRHEVLIVSDGIDRLGGVGLQNPYVDAAIADAQRAGAVVYTIYVTGAGHFGHSLWRMNWGQNYLAEIAEETGGEAYFQGFGEPVSFTPFLTDLAERLTHQYLVTFLAQPERKASLQQVKLSTEVPNAELVTATKVYVSAGN